MAGPRALAEPTVAAGLTPPRVWIYTTFAASPAGGNPAGVVVAGEPIDGALAQAIATVMSVPTTGFAVADQAALDGRASARFFTPRKEIDACGHVTIAVASAFVELGAWSRDSNVIIRTSGGDVPLRLRDNAVEMTQHLQALEEVRVSSNELEAGLGRVRRHPELPLAVGGTGLRHLLVPVAEPGALSELILEQERLAALAARAGVDTICVWAFAGSDRRVRIRDLCAGIGAVEEPASGTTSAALALYLAHYAELTGDLVVEQGVEMGRPSRIEVSVDGPDTVVVRGRAQRLVSGRLDLGLYGRHPWRHD